MKFKNFYMLLITHIILGTILLIFYFSILGLVSVISSFIFLVISFFVKNNSLLYKFGLVITILLIPIIYLTKPMSLKMNFDVSSILTIVFSLMFLVFALTMNKVSINSIYGIKTRDTMGDPEIWMKTNNFASICCYACLPFEFVMIFYLNFGARFFLSMILFSLLTIITIMYGSHLGIIKSRQYRKELNDESKKETGWL